MSTPNVHTPRCKPHSAKKARRVTPNSSASHAGFLIDADRREAMIREAAYFRAASRGFCPGHEVEDWLTAETEIDCILANSELPRFCTY